MVKKLLLTKNNFINYTSLIIILFILILIYYINNSYYKEHFNINLKYYRCTLKKIGTINNEIFRENNIKQDNQDWNIYIPCGYNNVEKELLSIQANSINNKYVYGINGCDSIVSKNKIWESLVNCFGRKEASLYMPESFVLHKSNDMDLFRKMFKKKNIYILKKNIQRKEGLKLTSNLDVILNSVLDNYRVVQKYLTDLYLINKRKVNLRIYLLIVIKNGYKTFYVSNIGKCIYTRKEYNNNNFDFESNITSYNLDMNVYKTNPRNFNELYKYVNDKSNNGKILFNNIDTLLRKVSQCLSKNIFQSSNIKNTTCFQLFGADVIFDNNLNTYLLELNKGPDMIPRDENDKLMKKKVQQDMFKIVGILPNIDTNVFYETYKTNL
jgi:hypothetical protein